MLKANGGGRGDPKWSSRVACKQSQSRQSKITVTDLPAPTANDTLVTVEIFYTYKPFLLSGSVWQKMVGGSDIYSRAFFRPRFSDLKDLK